MKVPVIQVSNEMTPSDIDRVIWAAIDLGCSDIFFDYGYKVGVDIGGKIYDLTDKTMMPNACRNVLEHMLGTKRSLINEVNTAKPTYFAYVTKNPNNPLDIRSFRVAAITARSLEYGKTFKINGRLNPETPKSASELGIEQDLINLPLQRNKGLMIFVGGTGTGKTTTMAGIVRSVLETPCGGKNILTFEDPPEVNYDNVRKAVGNRISIHEVGSVETDSDVESFSSGLVAALRLRPNIIVQGEIRTKASIESAINASNTGHFLMATIHANSCGSALSRLYNLIDGEDKRAVIGGLINEMTAMVAQILVRPTSGGRIAIREILYLDKDLKEQLCNCCSDNEIRALVNNRLREQGRTFSQQIDALYQEGIIGPEYLQINERD